MMRKLHAIFLILFAAGLMTASSCNDDDEPEHTPYCDFEWTGNDVPAPVTVQFINKSLWANLYEWDFGDGSTSTEKDPVHTYFNITGEPIDYIVKLKAIDNSTALYANRTKLIKILPTEK